MTNNSTASQPPEPPARVWIEQAGAVPFYRSTTFYAREIPNGIEYAHLEPIQRALTQCERNCVTYDRSINIRNEDWEALKDAINGGGKRG